MKNLRRILSMLLALAMLAAGGLFAVAETEPITLTCYVDYTWFPIDSWDGIIPKAITEATGVQLDVTVASDETQLGLMIASGDLPDLIYCWYNGANSVQLMSDDLSYAYEDLIAQYCPDWDVEAQFGSVIKTMSSLSPDGKYYTLADGFTSDEAWAASAGSPVIANFYLRADLLEAMDMEEPKTVDELLEILEAAKETYPEKVTCGLIPTHFVSVFERYMGLPQGGNGFIRMEDGTLVHTLNHPNYYDAQKFINSLYRAGYFIDENFIYTNENDMFKLVSEDKLFSMTHCQTIFGDVLNGYNAQSNPDARWICLDTLSGGNPDGFAETQNATGSAWSATYITKSCKNPEAAIKLMRYLFTDGLMTSVCGREGIDWWYDENGALVLSDELVASYSAEGSESYINKYQWRYAFGVSQPQQNMVPDYIAAGSERLREINSNFQKTYKHYEELNYVNLDPSSDEAVIKAKIDEYVTSARVRMIMATSDEEFDAIYNKMMEDCETMGLSDLEAAINEQVAAAMGK